MKTSKIASTRVAPAAQTPVTGLLCRKLQSPAEVSFSTPGPRLAGLWSSVRSLWEQNHRAKAISLMAEAARQCGQSAGSSIPTLFLMSHMRMESGDPTGAERCLQSAVKQLGQQAGISAKSDIQTRSRFSAIDTDLHYSIGSRDWLILAIQALLKDDLDSSLLWIQQADRRVFDSVPASESHQRLRLIGDLHAVLACVAVKVQETDEAERFLATAYQRHVQAESFHSVCRDLILTSRLALLQGQSDRAQTLLDAAECQLVVSLTPDEADCCPLMDIIYSDRIRLAGPSRGRYAWC